MIDWNGTLTGTAVDKCEHGIDKVEHRKVSDNLGYGIYLIATTCGHEGSKWEGVFNYTVRDRATNAIAKKQKKISDSNSTGKIWESKVAYLYNPIVGISTTSKDLISGIQVDIKCTYIVSCSIEKKVYTKEHNAPIALP